MKINLEASSVAKKFLEIATLRVGFKIIMSLVPLIIIELLLPTLLLSSVAEKTISLPPCQDWQESTTRVAELPQNLSQRSPAISPRLCWLHIVPEMVQKLNFI
jgi:hypothetical protein